MLSCSQAHFQSIFYDECLDVLTEGNEVAHIEKRHRGTHEDHML